MLKVTRCEFVHNLPCEQVSNRLTDLEAENAKLRELVRDFASYRHFDCRHCGYKEQCKARQTNCYKVFVGLFDRARELGIEVD